MRKKSRDTHLNMFNSARAHKGEYISLFIINQCIQFLCDTYGINHGFHVAATPCASGWADFFRCSTSCMRSFSIHYTVWLAPKFFCFICCCNSHISIFFFVPSLKYLNFAPYKRKRYIHSDCEWHTDWWGVLIRLQHTARSSTPPCLLLNSGLACRLTVYLKLQQN